MEYVVYMTCIKECCHLLNNRGILVKQDKMVIEIQYLQVLPVLNFIIE